MLRSTSRTKLLVALAVSLLVSTGTGALVGPSVGAQPRHAVVVADSILLGAKAPLVAQLERAGWTVDFDGAVSRSTLAGAEAVRSRAGGLTDTLVVSLGANDGGNPATFRQRVDAVMAAAASVPNVYWLTIREVRPYYGPANQVLRDAATRYPNLRLIDWHAASAGRSGLTSGDGLHLTGAGANELAGLVASTVTTGAAPLVAAPPVPTTEAPVTTTTAAPVETVPTTVPAPPAVEPVPEPTGTPTAATAPLDRSLFVADHVPGVAGRTAAAAAPPSGGFPWVWLLALAVLGTAAAFGAQRLGFRTVSGPVRHSPVSRSELRAARIAGARDRHPATVVAPPVPEEPSPEIDPSGLSGTAPDHV